MRAGWVAAVVLIALAREAAAQELPPFAPGPADVPALPNGEDVSRPLTPVEAPDPPAVEAVPVPEPVERVERVQRQTPEKRGPLGPHWCDYAYLMWWPKAHPLPPLATATRDGSPPAIGNPNTVLLVGGRAIGTPDVSGGRFVLGNPINEDETTGFELVYFFLGSRTLTASYGGGNPRIGALGLPFTNALTGQHDVFPVVVPGGSGGSVSVATTTRVQGAEANLVANLLDGKALKLNGLVGYRFLQVHEGLAVETIRRTGADVATTYDEFSAHNRFNGGQLGLHADVSRGIVYCELTGKVALGQTYEVVRIDGASRLAGAVVPGGVYAQTGNIGRSTRSVFAVVPEGTIKFGLRLTDTGRVYVGYNFLYLGDAVRPGDQLDPTLNPTQFAGGALAGVDRPRTIWNRSDFWVQGLMIGLETRY